MRNGEERAVLFVDDEPYVLAALKRALMNQGYKLVTASGAQEALSLLKSARFHVVVADYDMPEMLGPDFLERVRAEQPSAIRVVLTGATDLRIIQSFIQRGKAMRYLLKPWDLDELKATISECFDLYTEAA